MTTTDERLARLAQRGNRTGASAAAPSPGTSTPAADHHAAPTKPTRTARRKAAAPLTRIVTTGVSLSAVLAGAGFLALADRAASAPTPPLDVATTPAAGPQPAAATPPITVVVVLRQVPATSSATQAAQTPALAPAAVPYVAPLGSSAPKAAVTAAPKAAAVKPVTKTKKS